MNSSQIICNSCQTAFPCGNTNASSRCWCHVYRPDIKPDVASPCLCPSCLKERTLKGINRFIKEFILSGKTIDMTKYKTDSNIQGIDYHTENGLMVFSEWYLLKRGYCCGKGCRHCPY
ncbi:MAG TPA: DUF5522 domain-containing protein [Cyclobacteriaceae bacterium]